MLRPLDLSCAGSSRLGGLRRAGGFHPVLMISQSAFVNAAVCTELNNKLNYTRSETFHQGRHGNAGQEPQTRLVTSVVDECVGICAGQEWAVGPQRRSRKRSAALSAKASVHGRGSGFRA
ncbi:hypothetical protein AOLI_G00176710 [Acnodon oligacanthus]